MRSEFTQTRKTFRFEPLALALALAMAVLPRGALATPEVDPLAVLRSEIEALRELYEGRIDELEHRLAELEAERARERELEEIGALRQAAHEAAKHASEATEVGQAATAGHERNLNRFNPEISFIGEVLGIASDQDRDAFELGEFELNLQASLDPFSFAKVTVAVHESEVELEEIYIGYSALAPGLSLTAGRFRQSFGILNRWHGHALPQSSVPLALETAFGEEGLVQTGLGLRWLLPRLWADANELVLEITDGENEEAFAGEDFRDLAVLARWSQYWDLSEATYLEWGFSGVVSESVEGGDSRVWGTDLSLHWQPPNRAKYREITWRTEVLLIQREDELAQTPDAWGAYSYLEGLIKRNLIAGMRLDFAEDPHAPRESSWAAFPYVTWWQSEYVRMRGEYGYIDRSDGEAENRFTLQLTFAAGPHKHENY